MLLHVLLGLAFILLTACSSPGDTQDRAKPDGFGLERPARLRANGVELHYVQRGAGDPIVFVHGAIADYREWSPVAARLADTAAARLRIAVNESLELEVVDTIEADRDGRVRSIRAYKG